MNRVIEACRRAGLKPAVIALFIFCAMPLGITFAFLAPPGGVPDEVAHVARAAGLIQGEIMAHRFSQFDQGTGLTETESGVMVDRGLLVSVIGTAESISGRSVVTAADMNRELSAPVDHVLVEAAIPNTGQYFPAAYIPAAIGLGIGKAAGARPFDCLILARLFMLMAYLTLGVLSVWLTAYGEALLLTILLLPMTLSLASGVNPDGVLIASACLACATLTRGTAGIRLFGLIMLTLFAMTKLPYLLLLGAFLLPFERLGFWGRARNVAAASAFVFGWTALVIIFVSVPFIEPSYHPGPLYAGDRNIWLNHSDAAANLHILLAQPTRFVTLPWTSLGYYGVRLLQETIGVLGALQIQMPDFYYRLWACCLLASIAGLIFCRRQEAASKSWSPLSHLFILGLLLCTCWAIVIGAYVSWTNVGNDFIDGLQGRYLLPLLPFLLLGVPAWRGRRHLPGWLPLLPTVAMATLDIGYLPFKLATYYYLH